MPSSSRKSKAAVFLIAALAILALTPLFCMRKEDGVPREAFIIVDGEVVRRMPLAERRAEERFVVVTPYGENHIVTDGNSIRVEEADCPSKICVRKGAIAAVGEVIACLPHRLVIEIREKR